MPWTLDANGRSKDFSVEKHDLAVVLAKHYVRTDASRLVIAHLCDEDLDRSGELLGIVRELALKL